MTFIYKVTKCDLHSCIFCLFSLSYWLNYSLTACDMTHGDFMKPVVPAVSVSVMTESKSHVKESVADSEGLLIHVYFVCFHYLIG